MKRIILFIAAIMLLSACSQKPSGPVAGKNAEGEIQEGARAFKVKRYDEAKQHFDKALEIDPKNQKAAILRARVFDFLYEPGEKTPLNTTRGNEAIAAYKKVLALDPNNEEAQGAIINLLDMLDMRDEQRQMVLEIANNSTTPAERRSDFFAFLASKDWNCSYEITDAAANKKAILKDGNPVIQYLKPQNPNDFEKALRCATSGLEKAEKAISLKPDSTTALEQKYILLLEVGKLARMDGDEAKATQYVKQAEVLKYEIVKAQERARSEPSPSPSDSETELDSLVPRRGPDLRLIAPEPEPQRRP
ncbi:MAG TPA: tetratricopeptide repeat protein [Pyrinomonadaceae bacterium]